VGSRDRPNDRIKKRRLLQVSAGAAILVLLFGSMLSSRALAAVAGALVIGLLVHAWFGLQHPQRNAFVLRVLMTGFIAGCTAAVVVLLVRRGH
jgi:hypothetical protein